MATYGVGNSDQVAVEGQGSSANVCGKLGRGQSRGALSALMKKKDLGNSLCLQKKKVTKLLYSEDFIVFFTLWLLVPELFSQAQDRKLRHRGRGKVPFLSLLRFLYPSPSSLSVLVASRLQ